MTSPLRPDIEALVRAAATRFSFPYSLLAAQVLQESSGNPDAARFEEHYRYTWPPPAKKWLPRIIYPIGNCSRDTESVMQRTSWGLLQLMGANARALGYRGEYLNALTREHELALELGCRWMRQKLDRYPNIEDALSAYNAGSPVNRNRNNYVQPILATAERILADEFREA